MDTPTTKINSQEMREKLKPIREAQKKFNEDFARKWKSKKKK